MTLEVSSPDDKAYDDIVWDGLIHSYRPAPDWKTRVSPRLRLAADAVDEIDPVTFEVLRNRLWTINIAHGDTLTRMSGSRCSRASTSTCRSSPRTARS